MNVQVIDKVLYQSRSRTAAEIVFERLSDKFPNLIFTIMPYKDSFEICCTNADNYIILLRNTVREILKNEVFIPIKKA